jgi:hypothetical protein
MLPGSSAALRDEHNEVGLGDARRASWVRKCDFPPTRFPLWGSEFLPDAGKISFPYSHPAAGGVFPGRRPRTDRVCSAGARDTVYVKLDAFAAIVWTLQG